MEYSKIADMIREAESHATDSAGDRQRATEYYMGKMVDTPHDQGRSAMVTRDIRANIKKVLPSISRTIFGPNKVVEYRPKGPGDEEQADQSTDYMNGVVIPETKARTAIESAIFDALLLRNGILKWEWVETQQVEISSHSGLDDVSFGILAGDDDVEVMEHTEREETIETHQEFEDVQGPMPVDDVQMMAQAPTVVHDVKIRRTFTERCVDVGSVPRERFLIHPDAVTLQDSLLTGEVCEVSRSDLIRMGYDRELIMGLPVSSGEQFDEDRDEMRNNPTTSPDEPIRANQALDYYDVYVRADMDDDGISELRHVRFAGGLSEENLLMDEECDEIQYCDVAVMRQPHQWEGVSLADDLMDIQRGKTVLLRQTLDNIYWQNNPQPIVQGGAIQDMDPVYNPEFGKPIETKNGISVKDALGFNNVPFVAKDSFAMMEYLDAEAEDRTGVSEASAGLSPDSLQNMTATAAGMVQQAAIGETEMMVRTVAESLKPFFSGLLRLIIRHMDKPRTIRLRDEWVEVDPRQWNADMDVEVNTGLGAGTRERDMQVMQYVIGMQEKLFAALGADNPFVKPDDVWNALSRLVESAGLKTPELYFTEPDEQEIAQKQQEAASKPDPEMVKIQGQMALEEKKMQASAQKEREQMNADLVTQKAAMEAESQSQREKLVSDAALQAERLAWEREQFNREMAFKEREAARTRQDEIWKAQAEAFNPVVEEAANG